MNIYLKWLIFLLATPAQFCIAFILGLLATSVFDACFCTFDPINYQESGYCSNQKPIFTIFLSLGASLAAILIVIVGTITCPVKSSKVPTIIFLIGAVVTAIMGYSDNSLLIPAISTISFGFITATIMSKYVQRI